MIMTRAVEIKMYVAGLSPDGKHEPITSRTGSKRLSLVCNSYGMQGMHLVFPFVHASAILTRPSRPSRILYGLHGIMLLSTAGWLAGCTGMQSVQSKLLTAQPGLQQAGPHMLALLAASSVLRQ